MTPQDPLPHDPWLREALRHAPDAEAGPPARLDDHILRMGRAAVAPRPAATPPRPPTLGERLLAAWDWLARPPVAAGFAGVLVATTVGVMWWGRPISEALPPREAPAATAPAPAPTPPEPPAVAVAPAAAPADARARSAELDKPAARAEAPARKAAAPEPSPAPQAAAPPAPATPPAAADKKAEKAAPAEAATTLRGAAEQRELAAAAPAPAAPPAAPPAAGMAAADAAAPAALNAMRARAAVGTIETAGLSNLRFEIRPRPQAWTWQRDDGPVRPVDDALQNWIALADRTARPHWNPGPAAGEGATTTLRFTRDGTLRATLRVGPKGLRLDRSGKSESAELSSAQAATLLDALETLGP